jgi:hypothetical protein
VSSNGEVNAMPNVETILRDEVSLQVECIDRIYMCGYVKALQRPNQLAYFLNVHRKNPLASPALLIQMTKRFVDAVEEFAHCNGIPFVQFKADQRKDDIARARFARFRAQEGVVFIGVAQEYDRAFRSKPRRNRNGGLGWFEFFRSTVAVKHYYFYILDRDWGPGFIKFSTYVPFGGTRLPQRPRVGQAPARAGRCPVPGARQRLSIVRRLGHASGHLRCPRQR